MYAVLGTSRSVAMPQARNHPLADNPEPLTLSHPHNRLALLFPRKFVATAAAADIIRPVMTHRAGKMPSPARACARFRVYTHTAVMYYGRSAKYGVKRRRKITGRLTRADLLDLILSDRRCALPGRRRSAYIHRRSRVRV